MIATMSLAGEIWTREMMLTRALECATEASRNSMANSQMSLALGQASLAFTALAAEMRAGEEATTTCTDAIGFHVDQDDVDSDDESELDSEGRVR